MEAMNLDPGDYRGTYKPVGGRPSLDFINTISWPETERRHDWLGSPGNVKRWFQAMNLPFPRGKEVELDSLRDIRHVMNAVLRPLAHGEPPARDAVDQLSKAVARAQQSRLIDAATLTWRWPSPQSAAEALFPLLLDAAELVTAGDHGRLRYCPSCDWLFEDQTRNGQRRWCDMADCGSRDKARRYYHRTKD
ncbi:CGNR zinc finger domain-containing protein [Dyella choica]|uniref:Zinc finger CGNR domain-containing protein n=1 Tax=Dyella choica TaxID=1927959 RepID=A0A3S0S8V7_9GAMM|nr:ABATE domain-containing protein [Dyella choica]RUL73626.1 hypothetical protein EKH80_15005 [Dyella choica]